MNAESCNMDRFFAWTVSSELLGLYFYFSLFLRFWAVH